MNELAVALSDCGCDEQEAGIYWAMPPIAPLREELVEYDDFATPARAWFASRPAPFPEGSWEEADLEGPAQYSGNLRAYVERMGDPEAFTGLEFEPGADADTGEAEGTPTIVIEDEVYA